MSTVAGVANCRRRPRRAATVSPSSASRGSSNGHPFFSHASLLWFPATVDAGADAAVNTLDSQSGPRAAAAALLHHSGKIPPPAMAIPSGGTPVPTPQAGPPGHAGTRPRSSRPPHRRATQRRPQERQPPRRRATQGRTRSSQPPHRRATQGRARPSRPSVCPTGRRCPAPIRSLRCPQPPSRARPRWIRRFPQPDWPLCAWSPSAAGGDSSPGAACFARKNR